MLNIMHFTFEEQGAFVRSQNIFFPFNVNLFHTSCKSDYAGAQSLCNAPV